MGYETKLIVAIQYKKEEKPNLSKPYYYEVVAQLNLAGMPNEFFVKGIFTKEVEVPVYTGDVEITEDKYGKKLCYCDDIKKVLRVLHACEGKEHYRRTELAINTLKSFDSSDWAYDNIVVINYGY